MIEGIQPGDMDLFLPRLRPFLENMAESSGGRVTADELGRLAREGMIQVWVAGLFEAVCITRTWDDAVQIDGCVGESRERWAAELEAEIRAWGKSLGKKKLFIHCRPGWSRWLKTIGYQEAHREMVVDLA